MKKILLLCVAAALLALTVTPATLLASGNPTIPTTTLVAIGGNPNIPPTSLIAIGGNPNIPPNIRLNA